MRILVTGAGGQIGLALVPALQAQGHEVLATDIQPLAFSGPTQCLDVTNVPAVRALLESWRPDAVYHLAAFLSARSEKEPRAGWRLNFEAFWELLEACVTYGVKQVFWASSIAAFGPHTPRHHTPQYAPMDPIGLYGIAKLTAERLSEYFFLHYSLDVRSLRFPGVVGPGHLPQGGTTDFAVHMFYAAKKEKRYCCYLLPHTRLPMIYLSDAIRAILELMEAPAERLTVRSAYNIQGLSFSPAELVAHIQRRVPDFVCTYEPDFRQRLAESWPESLDDSYARREWGWQPHYDLPALVESMWQALEPLS
ncbi:MAG: NAD-dependent epimerase/dehydratase family protein [Bacteroidia bacterium]|nr:NAD-dependent epimerase/dehydratase family protein [Bacteroidia bacterium]MDW8088838.1 NAD-dependent epimerase/dehydratase family protein [Bacteroidia bacterium]